MSMEPQQPPNTLQDRWYPERYDASDAVAMQRCREILAAPGIVVCETLRAQLRELVECRNPRKKWSPAEADEQIPALTGGAPLDRYGAWVYYPWASRVVHVLPEAQFIEVRTSRNRYKLKTHEQALLASRAIGVVGLSVGQASAVTLALEGIGRQYRLADPDYLSLSNMNRLRASLADLGLNKCVIAARQMFEIDPYLDIRIYPQGVSAENIEGFFLDGGPIHLLVEECDDLAMKILVRDRARAHRVPVVMDTNDRGMLDIERFDLEPSRPLLHGLLGDITPAEVRGLSTYDKVPYFVKILPPEAMSMRLKTSLVEIDETVSGWPQLASGVALGGALVADAARRIFLGEITFSGRFFVDLDEVIHENTRAPLSIVDSAPSPPPPVLDVPGLVPAAFPPPVEHLRRLVEFAILAPSGGNIQPWLFTIQRDGRIRCDLDPVRSRQLLDYDRTASLLALGAAVENMAIAARAMGLSPHVEMIDDPARPDTVCRLAFQEAPAEVEPLFHELGRRSANRRRETRIPMTSAEQDALVDAARERGASLQLATSAAQIDALADVIGGGDRVRFLSQTLHREMMEEIRWTHEEAVRTGDGVDLRTLELNRTELAGMDLLKDWDLMAALKDVGGGGGLDKITRKTLAVSSAVGLLTAPGISRDTFFAGGRAVQRVWLTASRIGLAFQPMSVLTYLFARMERGAGEGLNGEDVAALKRIRSAYREIFEVGPDDAEVFLFRLGKAGPPTARAIRRALADVLTIEG
jgi:hypothetical protein